MSADASGDTNSNSQSARAYEIYDDPLFLSSSDQPNLLLVGYQFNGSNFISWKRDAYLALMAKNKEGFIDGACKKPEKSDKKYHQWICCDLMVMRWLLNSIQGNICETLIYVNNSKELWTELIERYGQTNSLEIYQIKKDLSSITQDNTPLIEYYSKLKQGWESIDSLYPLPVCTCGALESCTCQLLKKMLDRDSNSKLIQLLMGLNSGYEGVKTTVLSMEPLPPLNKALGLLQKIERQRQIADAVDVLAEANAYAAGHQLDVPSPDSKMPNLDSSTSVPNVKRCSHCNIYGHSREECFKLKECSHCGKKGHVRDMCYRLRNNGKFSNSRGRSHFQSGKNVYRRNDNHADVVGVEDAEEYSPLDDAGAPAKASMVDPRLMEGIVHNVMEQFLKAFSEKTATASTATFTGPFK